MGLLPKAALILFACAIFACALTAPTLDITDSGTIHDLTTTGHAAVALNWTYLNNYPSACSSGYFVSAVGDTLTCSAGFNTTNETDPRWAANESRVTALETWNGTTNQRVDDLNSSLLSLNNLSYSQIVASIGNWSAENASVRALYYSNVTDLQASNTSTNARIDDLNTTKLNATDQRYNETWGLNWLNASVCFSNGTNCTVGSYTNIAMTNASNTFNANQTVNGSLGVKTAPSVVFHVLGQGTMPTQPAWDADDLAVFSSSDDGYVQVHTAAGKVGGIMFSDNNRGGLGTGARLQYDHSSDAFALTRVLGIGIFMQGGSGNTSINTQTTSTATLLVNGTLAVTNKSGTTIMNLTDSNVIFGHGATSGNSKFQMTGATFSIQPYGGGGAELAFTASGSANQQITAAYRGMTLSSVGRMNFSVDGVNVINLTNSSMNVSQTVIAPSIGANTTPFSAQYSLSVLGQLGIKQPSSNAVALTLIDSTGSGYFYMTPYPDDGIHLTSRDVDGVANNNIIFTNSSNYNKDHDHDALSSDPTVFVHSRTNPDTDNTQWMSISHNTTNALITSGKGSIVLQNNTQILGTMTAINFTAGTSEGITKTITVANATGTCDIQIVGGIIVGTTCS